MLTDKFKDHISQRLNENLNVNIKIDTIRSLSGGSINDAYRIQSGDQSFFIKVNSANRFPGMFSKEANGLAEMRKSKTIRIPDYICDGDFEGLSFLVLEYIETAYEGDWHQFAESLATMHRKQSGTIGFFENNYMGSLEQSNRYEETWPDFFVNQRLLPQLELASSYIDKKLTLQFESLFKKMNQLLPDENSHSLVHGDLWSGNFIFNQDGEAVLIDPAVYYGHREVDIAMTTLFGGFDSHFYTSYQDIYPMDTGWQQRLKLYNLYPLLIHVNLFGASYLDSVKSVLNSYS